MKERRTYLRLLSLCADRALYAFLCDGRAGAVVTRSVLWLVDMGDNAQGDKLFSQATFGFEFFT